MNHMYLTLTLLFCVFTQATYAQVTGNIDACENDIEMYNVPVVPGGSYSWNITGGAIQGAANVDSAAIQWGLPGTGTIIVTVNNPSGPPTFHTLNVTVHAKPNPIITFVPYPTCPPDIDSLGSPTGQPRGDVCENVCKGATITYTTTLNPLSTYLWVVAGASSVTGATTNTATITWDNSGLGNIILYETNQWGCVDSSTICIKKQDVPTAAFSHQASVCKFSNTLFTNLSTGASSYEWTFGDGGTSTQANPTYSYTSPGTYTVTLIALNDCYCADTFQSTIVVDSLPGPTITCPATLCGNDTATYSTPVAPGCTYNWFAIGGTIIAGLGTPNVTVAWGPGQMGTLGLTLTGCGGVCNDTTLVYIPLVPATGTITGADKVCPGDCEYYSLPRFSGGKYSWSLASGGCGVIQDSTCCETVKICWSKFLFSCTDTLNVAYFDSFLNCGGTAQYIIRLRPRLEIMGNSPVCANSTATFSASGGITSNWTVTPSGPILTGSPSTSISVNWNNVPGNYVIAATPVNPNQSCTDTAYYSVKVVAPPAAPVITGDTVICPGSTLSYCATGGPEVNWIINGGSPTASIGNCVTVLWNASGPYSVRAFIKTPNAPSCHSDTTLQNIFPFTPIPPVLTGPAIACANATNTFATTTVYPSGTTYNWTITPSNAGAVFSPGGASTAIEWGNNAPQIVTVTLTVNVCGSVFTNALPVNLNPVPTPTINQLGSLCAGGSAQLQAVGGAYTGFSWTGPGGYTSATNPTTITQEGLYNVTVSDAAGCTGKTQINVEYVSGPNASISTSDFTNYCIGAIYAVNICALGNPNYTYSWSPPGVTQCVIGTSPGSYTVTVTDISNGCTATSNTIVINEGPCTPSPCQPDGNISFTHTGCNPVAFTNTSVNGSNFLWNFGDMNTSLLTSPTHTYTQAGFYLVVLSGNVPNITGTGFCPLIDTAKIEIPLAAKFDVATDCDGLPVCFTDMSSYTAGNSITSWSWNFGDANTSTLQHPCHTYAAPGSYTVVLTISNGPCSATYTKTVVVAPGPNAAFTFTNPNCLNTAVGFTDASVASITGWDWNFGDLGTSLNQNPSHNYNVPTTFPVTLIVTDMWGCKDTVVNPVNVVVPALSGSITAFPDTVVCTGTQVLLVAPPCGTCTYLWNTGSNNDSIIVTTTGIYTVTLTDANGCPYTTFIRIIINNGPPAIIKNSGPNKICLGSFYNLSATYNVNWLYQWISNDGVNNGATSSNIGNFPSSAGLFTYQLVITDTTTGCSDTSLPYIMTVNAPPVPPTITPATPTNICADDTIVLVGSHPDASVNLLWSTGEVSNTIWVTEGGCYQLQATDTNGCKSSANLCVTVNPLPDLCSFYEGCVDTCRPFTMTAPVGSTYQWLMNGSIISSATNQTYSATLDGAYSVIVTNSFGCTDTTGELDLSLRDCDDTICGDMFVDSIYCDPAGNYVLVYHIVNNTSVPLTQLDLDILPPFLHLPYAPSTVYTSVAPGGTSAQFSTTIYSATAGDTLCFRTHLGNYDSLGNEILCCYTDTICIPLPPCPQDTACCYFDLVSDSVWCEQTTVGPKYNFTLQINGCGTMDIQTTSTGVLNVTNPYTLVPGLNTISGSYIPSSPDDTLMCLLFMIHDGMQNFCKDTIICFPINCKQHPLPCKWDYKRRVCEGQPATFFYTGSPVGLTINWSFIGGTPPTATGPGPHTVTYSAPGTYWVSMTLTNAFGTTTCRDTIVVVAAPVASVTQTGNTLYASPAGLGYQWTSGPPLYTPITGASNQFFTPTVSDLYCVIVTNSTGCRDTACIDHIWTGIGELDVDSWNIFPNPNEGSFTLSLSATRNEPVKMTLVNTLGEVVDIRTFEVRTGQQSFYISNAHLSAGVYFIQITTEGGTSVRRIVVR